jgi:hypothetical protein
VVTSPVRSDGEENDVEWNVRGANHHPSSFFRDRLKVDSLTVELAAHVISVFSTKPEFQEVQVRVNVSDVVC